MKINHKGFTLIESIVTFAIIAIAGAMFILGFYNVSIIAGESALIKNSTNTLYQNIIESSTDDYTENTMKMTIDGISNSVSFECGSVTLEDNVSLGDDFKVSLTRFFVESKSDDWLPNTGGEENPYDPPAVIDPNFIKVNFLLLKDKNDASGILINHEKCFGEFLDATDTSSGNTLEKIYVPLSYQVNVTYIDYFKEVDTILANVNKVNSVLGGSYEISNAINQPNVLSNAFAPYYKQYDQDIIWFQIQKKSAFEYYVIGYIKPKYNYVPQFTIYDKNGALLFQAPTNTNKLNGLLNSDGNDFKNKKFKFLYNDDDEEYNLKSIIEFADRDNTKDYTFVIVE